MRMDDEDLTGTTVLSSDSSGLDTGGLFGDAPASTRTPVTAEDLIASMAPVVTPTPEPSTPTVMKQGASYEGPVDYSSYFEDEEETPEKEDKTKREKGEGIKIPIKNNTTLIIAAVAILLIVCLFVFGPKLFSNFSKEKEPEVQEPTDYIENEYHGLVYTTAEWVELRHAGYSGEEIEAAQEMQIPADDLIVQAEEEREAWWNSEENKVVEQVEVVLDTELQNKLNGTWYGLQHRDDVEDFSELSSYYQVTRNLDYEKVEPYGYQLMIKVYINEDHSDYFFAQLNTEQYLSLKQAGNIVTTYTYCHCLITSELGYSEDETRMFITDYSFQIIDN